MGSIKGTVIYLTSAPVLRERKRKEEGICREVMYKVRRLCHLACTQNETDSKGLYTTFSSHKNTRDFIVQHEINSRIM